MSVSHFIYIFKPKRTLHQWRIQGGSGVSDEHPNFPDFFVPGGLRLEDCGYDWKTKVLHVSCVPWSIVTGNLINHMTFFNFIKFAVRVCGMKCNIHSYAYICDTRKKWSLNKNYTFIFDITSNGESSDTVMTKSTTAESSHRVIYRDRVVHK